MTDTTTKTYKTELIIAVITAITGITVALITNWDKIFKNENSGTRKTEITQIGNKPIDTAKYYYGYKELEWIGAYTQVKSEAGWEIEGVHTFIIQPDSVYSAEVDFNKTKKYLIIITSPDTTVHSYNALIVNTFLKEGQEMKIRDKEEMKMYNLQIDYNGIRIRIPNQAKTNICSMAIVSKEL